MGLGQYPLRLPSYRSAYARRYHPYPIVHRRSNNNEYYMNPIPDFDYEAAEHVSELPPSLQLRPVRRNDDDGDVMAFELDGGASKDAKANTFDGDKTLVVIVNRRRVDHADSKSAMAKPSAKLAILYTLLLFLHYARDRLTKARTDGLGEKLPK